MQWRGMTVRDLPRVMRVAEEAHPSYPEAPEVFEERLRLFPKGCLVLEEGGKILGYLVSHPWVAESTPPLDARLGALPAEPGCYYIHDLALLPAARGTGMAKAAVAIAADVARAAGLSRIMLVAVSDAHAFWKALAFTGSANGPSLSGKGYGPEARVLVRM